MMSEVWMKAFAEDPECSISDLPPEMQSEFKRRAEQAMEGAGGYPKEASEAFQASGTIALAVQRCVKARLLVDEATDRWADLGRGLFVGVSFTKRATVERLAPAARCFQGTFYGSIASENDGPQGFQGLESHAGQVPLDREAVLWRDFGS